MLKYFRLLLSVFMFHHFVVPMDGAGGMEEENPQNTPPATTPPPQPNDTNIDDEAMAGAITKDEAKLSLLQEEFTTMADNLHNEFESILERNPQSLFTPEEIETLEVGGNIAEKAKLMRDGFEKFRDEKLTLKKQEIDGFGQELGKRKNQYDIVAKSKQFAKENPNVDMAVFSDFIQDLKPSVKKAIIEQSNGDKYQFLKLAYEEFKKEKGTPKASEDEEDDLPPNLNELNGQSADFDATNTDKEQYLRQIGAMR